MTDPTNNNSEVNNHLFWDTGSGKISFSFNRDSTFVLTPNEEDGGIINIGGIADFVLEKASGLETDEYDKAYENLLQQFIATAKGSEELQSRVSPYINGTKIGLESVRKDLKEISDSFKRDKRANSDLQAYELDLDPYAFSILTILFASKKKAESVK